jgi:DNA-binding MarR family transcriptional regulator
MGNYKSLIQAIRVQRAQATTVSEVLRYHRITVNEWLILNLVHDGVTSMTTLAKELDTSLAYITITTKTMLAKRLIRKRAVPGDLRKRELVYSAGHLLADIEQELAS